MIRFDQNVLKVAGYECVFNRDMDFLTIGCESHDMDYWEANWRTLLCYHKSEITPEKTMKLLAYYQKCVDERRTRIPIEVPDIHIVNNTHTTFRQLRIGDYFVGLTAGALSVKTRNNYYFHFNSKTEQRATNKAMEIIKVNINLELGNQICEISWGELKPGMIVKYEHEHTPRIVINVQGEMPHEIDKVGFVKSGLIEYRYLKNYKSNKSAEHRLFLYHGSIIAT
jgi:hypothetical protein